MRPPPHSGGVIVLDAARWYIALTLIALPWVLPAARAYRALPSRGLPYVRPVALAGTSVALWVIVSSRVIPYGTITVLVVVAVPWLWSGWLLVRGSGRDILRSLPLRLLIATEIVGVLVFALVLAARAQAPGALFTEKPMDLAMLTAVHGAEWFPPADPWLSGERISYYHLGHVATDGVGRLSGNGPGTAFNLGLASVAAMIAMAAFGVASDLAGLTRARRRMTPYVAGTLGMIVVIWVAPLEGVFELLAANGIGGSETWSRLGVEGFVGEPGAKNGVPTDFWWWWRSTRILPGTISEYPAFSLLLGDLHAHVMAVPLALAAIAISVATLPGTSTLTPGAWRRDPGTLYVAAALFAAIAMTNSWDVIGLGLLWAIAAWISLRRVGWGPVAAGLAVIRYMLWPTLAALALAAPFLLQLDAPPIDVALVTGERSDPVRHALVWFTPFIPVLVAVVLALSRSPGGLVCAARNGGVLVLLGVAPIVFWGLTLLATGRSDELSARGSGWITLVALTVALALAAGVARRHMAGRLGEQHDTAKGAAATLLATALATLLLTELIRVDDAFPGRLNTVFKLWYQAWVLVAVAGAALLARAVDDTAPVGSSAASSVRPGAPLRRAPPAASGLIAVPVALALVTVLGASLLVAPAMAVSRAREGQHAGLDAREEIRRRDAGLHAAALWAQSELDPDLDVLLQAVGPSYSAGNVLAAMSGIPTLLGWPNHELQWRGPEPTLGSRESAVDAIYEGGGDAAAAEASRRGITHVYVGREERARYGNDVDSRFAGWDEVFRAGGAVVYRVPAATE